MDRLGVVGRIRRGKRELWGMSMREGGGRGGNEERKGRCEAGGDRWMLELWFMACSVIRTRGRRERMNGELRSRRWICQKEIWIAPGS